MRTPCLICIYYNVESHSCWATANGIGDSDAVDIANGMLENRTLTYLDLGGQYYNLIEQRVLI